MRARHPAPAPVTALSIQDARSTGRRPVHLSTASRAVRGSAIRDLLSLTSRPEVISLAGGLPATDLLPRERIATAAAAALADPAAVQYGETAGLPSLRAVLAAHESARCGRPVTDVVVTSGSQQGLDLVARALLDRGDPVVVEEPAYVGALQVFQAAGAALHPVPLDADGLRVDVLERRLRDGLRPRLVHTVPTSHNPRGVTLAPGRRARLTALAETFGFLVVEDDPYGLLAYDGAPPLPVAAHSDRVVRLGSASKVLAPALRVGWVSGPPAVLAAVERLKQCTDLCTSSLTQAIAADLLGDPAFLDAHLRRVRDATAARAAAFTAAIAGHLPGARCSVPAGGMFCWLELPGVDTTALLPRALEHGVGFVPGSAFAVHAPQRESLRCCFASHPEPVIAEAVRRLADAAT